METKSESSKKYRAKLRSQIISALGGKCAICGTTENLQLHHIQYEIDSIKHDNSRMESRYLEARDHPERFMLLCAIHHPWGANTLPPRIPITRWDELWKKHRLWRYKVREWGERSTSRRKEPNQEK